jgi:hypothetical protein
MNQSGRDGDDADLPTGNVENLRGLLRTRKRDRTRDGKNGKGRT